MRILITGGAGFVGSSLAQLYREHYPQAKIVAFDNLRRRGSESNLNKFRRANIEFVHGDIRSTADFQDLSGNFDLMIEASAEPSVLAGVENSPRYVIDTNLNGTVNALEFARAHVDTLVFLSTSRVYSIAPLRDLKLEESTTRFEIAAKQFQPGVGSGGISENFPVHLARSFYGTTKLASEYLIQEYAAQYGMKAIINRSGVIAGPGQFGKVDQGVFTLWAANHYFGKPLAYTGFGGKGKQVRDLLHPKDLFQLLELQTPKAKQFSGDAFNIGGGRAISTSLLEWTQYCQEASGKKTALQEKNQTNAVDIPLYISDSSKAREAFGWIPKISAKEIACEITEWIRANESELGAIFSAENDIR